MDRIDFRFRPQPTDPVASLVLQLIPIFEIHGGSEGHEVRKYTVKSGCRTVQESSVRKETISAEASGKINVITWSAEASFMSQYVSTFSSTVQETNEEQTSEREIYIDFKTPCFYYTASVGVWTRSGGDYQFYNPTVIQSPTKLISTRYEVRY